MVLVRLRVVGGSMELGERSEILSKQLDSRLASVRQSARLMLVWLVQGPVVACWEAHLIRTCCM